MKNKNLRSLKQHREHTKNDASPYIINGNTIRFEAAFDDGALRVECCGRKNEIDIYFALSHSAQTIQENIKSSDHLCTLTYEDALNLADTVFKLPDNRSVMKKIGGGRWIYIKREGLFAHISLYNDSPNTDVLNPLSGISIITRVQALLFASTLKDAVAYNKKLISALGRTGRGRGDSQG